MTTQKRRGRPAGSKNKKPAANNKKPAETQGHYLGVDSDNVQAFRCSRQAVAAVTSLQEYLGKVPPKDLWPHSELNLTQITNVLADLTKRLERTIK